MLFVLMQWPVMSLVCKINVNSHTRLLILTLRCRIVKNYKPYRMFFNLIFVYLKVDVELVVSG